MVGHEEDGHRALVLDHAQPALGVEAGLVDHLQAELHGRVHQRDAGEGEERAGVQPPGAGPVRLDGADHGAVGVADGHALGAAGRARGVEDVGQVLGLARAPGRASGRRRWPRPTRAAGRARPAADRPGLRAGVDQGEEAARPGLAGRCAAGRRRRPRRWHPSARACGPPRPGPGGGSWGRRRRRPGARPSTTRASAAPARAAGGCRPGRRARGRPRARRRAMALAAPSHSAKVMDPTSTTAKAVRSPNSSAMRPRCSSINTVAGPPGGCRRGKLTPVSGSLQHGRCASGGQSRGRPLQR